MCEVLINLNERTIVEGTEEIFNYKSKLESKLNQLTETNDNLVATIEQLNT